MYYTHMIERVCMKSYSSVKLIKSATFTADSLRKRQKPITDIGRLALHYGTTA